MRPCECRDSLTCFNCLEDLNHDRDRWKALAERMAGILEDIEVATRTKLSDAIEKVLSDYEMAQK